MNLTLEGENHNIIQHPPTLKYTETEGENHNIIQHPPTPKYIETLKHSASLLEKFKELISPTLTKLRKKAGKSTVSSDESSEKPLEEETQLEL